MEILKWKTEDLLFLILSLTREGVWLNVYEDKQGCQNTGRKDDTMKDTRKKMNKLHNAVADNARRRTAFKIKEYGERIIFTFQKIYIFFIYLCRMSCLKNSSRYVRLDLTYLTTTQMHFTSSESTRAQ